MKKILLAIFLPTSFNACVGQDECTTRQNEKLPVERTNHLVVQSSDGNSIVDMGFRTGKIFPNSSNVIPNGDVYNDKNGESFFAIADNFVKNTLHPIMDVKPDGQTIWYTLYTFDTLKEMDTIKANDVIGISVYAKKSNILHHKVYKREGDRLINLAYFNARVDGIVTNHFYTFASYFFREEARHLNIIRFATTEKHFDFATNRDQLNEIMEDFVKNPEIAKLDFNRDINR